MEFFVEKRKSEKKGKEYVAMFVKVNDNDLLLSVDTSIILAVTDLKMSELMSLQVGKKIIIK